MENPVVGLWKSRINVLFENCVLGRPPIEFRLNQLENKAQSRAANSITDVFLSSCERTLFTADLCGVF